MINNLPLNFFFFYNHSTKLNIFTSIRALTTFLVAQMDFLDFDLDWRALGERISNLNILNQIKTLFLVPCFSTTMNIDAFI